MTADRGHARTPSPESRPARRTWPRRLVLALCLCAGLVAGQTAEAAPRRADRDLEAAYSALRGGVANLDHVRVVAMGAAKGDAMAAEVLGWLFATGTVIRQDRAKAVGWYVRAASSGSPAALDNARALMGHLKATERSRLAPSWLRYLAGASAAMAEPVIRRNGDAAAPGPWANAMVMAERAALTRMIESATIGTRVTPSLAKAVAKVESNFRPDARSRAGARGVMQMMPATASGEFGVHPDVLWDANHNIVLGVRYLDMLISRYGAVDVALSFYNGGSAVGPPGAARVTPWTRDYVDSVLAWERIYANRPEGQPSGLPLVDPASEAVASGLVLPAAADLRGDGASAPAPSRLRIVRRTG